MKTIILTTNFSTGARNACKFGIQMFRDVGCKYVLMNSYYEPPATYDIMTSADDALERNSMKNLQAEKEALLAEFPDWKLDIVCESIYGMLASAVNQAVRTHEADYVVIGNKTKFSIENVIMRRKTADIIGQINATILAIPENVNYRSLEKIAFASDLKMVNDTTQLDPVKSIGKKHDSCIDIIHVAKEGQKGVELQKSPTGVQLGGYFADMKHRFHKAMHDDVAAGISSFVSSNKSGLVVLLARKHSFFKRLFEPSRTKEVSELSEVPLLILKES
jgi:hypothetical protein